MQDIEALFALVDAYIAEMQAIGERVRAFVTETERLCREEDGGSAAPPARE